MLYLFLDILLSNLSPFFARTAPVLLFQEKFLMNVPSDR